VYIHAPSRSAPPPAPEPEPETEAESEAWEEPPFMADPLPEDEPEPQHDFAEEPEEMPVQDWVPPPEPEDALDAELFDDEPVETEGPQELEPARVADLIGYLGDLSRFLPEEKLRQLQEDTIPLKMEKIRHTLSGTVSANPATNPWPVKGEAASTTKQKLKVIMDRLKDKLAE
jgi:hypothetical protein